MKRARAVRATRVVAALLAAVTGTACSDEPAGPDIEFQVIEELEYAPELGVDLSRMTRTNLGLYYEDLVVGDGDEARTADRAVVDYVGWLANGSEFARGTLDFIVDSGIALPGINAGVRGMRPGGVRLLVVPPGLGFGASAQPGIPPGSVLVYRLELRALS